MHRATVGSYGVGGSYERGAPLRSTPKVVPCRRFVPEDVRITLDIRGNVTIFEVVEIILDQVMRLHFMQAQSG